MVITGMKHIFARVGRMQEDAALSMMQQLLMD